MEKITDLNLNDASFTKFPESDISQAIVDAASQYLDEAQTRSGHDIGENDCGCEFDLTELIVCENLRFDGDRNGLTVTEAYKKGSFFVKDAYDSDSVGSSDASERSDADEVPDEAKLEYGEDKEDPYMAVYVEVMQKRDPKRKNQKLKMQPVEKKSVHEKIVQMKSIATNIMIFLNKLWKIY